MPTYVKHASGLKLVLKIGDGASPEQFNAMCSINAERGIQFQGTERTFTEIDCDDPEALAWLVAEMESKRILFNGAGTANTPDIEDTDDWWGTGEARNCQLVLDVPAADGGLIWQGAFVCPNYELTGNRGEKINFNLSVGSSGPVTRVANS